jgi:hypothetical protein
MINDKKIYILGAGASKAVGLPIQTEIINRIFTLGEREVFYISNHSFIDFDESRMLISGAYLDFCKYRKRLAEFFILLFGVKEDINRLKFIQSIEKNSNEMMTYEKAISNDGWEFLFNKIKNYHTQLEDIYTIFDKASKTSEYFRVFTDRQLSEFRESLNKCIIFIIAYYNLDGNRHSFTKDFSDFLVGKLKSKIQSNSRFGIISMNWDTVIDHSLFEACTRRINPHENRDILIDYCCNNSSLNRMATISNRMKFSEIKIIKLHGSTNWLECNNCGRLYTDYSTNILIKNLYESNCESKIKCDYCESNEVKYELRPIIIAPTFLKELNSIPLRNIWQSAFHELSNANEIVFIGYSFPDADFEFRYLLKKAINPEARIKVVLHQSDNPEVISKGLKRTSKKILENITSKLNLPSERYNSFFSSNKIEFNYEGFEKAYRNGFIT